MIGRKKGRGRAGRPGYEHGEPAWVALSASDATAAQRFYEGLFGWLAQPVPQPGPAESATFHLDGAAVAGVGPPLAEGRPGAWLAHLAVDSCDAVAERAVGEGGTVLVAPADVGDAGRLAVLADPGGATVATWEGRARPGAGLKGRPGSFCWTELATREVAASRTFYERLFGWEANELDFGAGTYTEWRLGSRSVAGMVAMGPKWPPEVPAHWLVYFAVGDCEEAGERVVALGGEVAVPCTDIPPGRFSVVRDPQGAVCALIRLAVPD